MQRRAPSDGHERSAIRLWGLRLLCALFVSLTANAAFAVIHNAFESTERSWQVAEHDCRLRIQVHERSFREAHTGNGSEYFRYWAGSGGSRALLAHDISPARVIDELVPSVWIKSGRAGLRLSLRVVLPRSRDPKTGGPVTTLIWGDSYEAPGTWQELKVSNVTDLLTRQVRLLRTRLGPSIDDREAYADKIVLNAYAGDGTAELWLDDLSVAGFAAAPAVPLPAPGSTPEVNDVRQPSVAAPEVRGSILYVDGRPFSARIIEGRGESFAYLSELGFNAVRLQVSPTAEQVAEAERLGLWLLAPQPEEGQAELGRRHLCWSLGNRLGAQEFAAASQRAVTLQNARREERRPILSHVVEAIQRYAGISDLVLFEQAPIGSSFELMNCPRRWRTLGDQLRPIKPFWATVQTELSLIQRDQVRAFNGGKPVAADVEAEQIWLQVVYAAAGGARGILFRSDTPLDGEDAAAKRRSTALKIANGYLQVMEPWMAAGRPGRPKDLRKPGYYVSALETEHSQLLLVCRASAEQQYLVGPASRPGPLAFEVPGRHSSHQAYRVRLSGLQPIRALGVGSGTIEVADPGLLNLIVLTGEEGVKSYLNKTTAAGRDALSRAESDLALQSLAETKLILRQLAAQRRADPRVQSDLDRCESMLERSRQLVAGREAAGASQIIESANEVLRRIRLRHWHAAAMEFATPNASPLCVSFRTLPVHWNVAAQMETAVWGPNQMAAGTFEDLQHLLDRDWRRHQSATASVESRVDLTLESPRNGRHALKLHAWSLDPNVQIDEWPVWMTSATVPVNAGQLFQVRAWVRVPERVRGSSDGLMIFDTLTGIDQAIRTPSTSGWDHLTFYRVAPTSGDLQIVIAMTGIGEAYVDDVEVKVLRR